MKYAGINEMRHSSSSLSLALLLCLCALTVKAQQTPERTVYVEVTSTIEALSPDSPDLKQFATSLLQLQFKSLKGLKVVLGKPPCDARVSGMVTQTPDQTQEQTSTPESDQEVFYSMEVSIDQHGTSSSRPEMTLDYKLFKFVNCAPKPLIVPPTDLFTERTALQSLVQMGDVIGLRFAEELAPGKATVDVAEIAGPQPVKQKLADAVLFQLSLSADDIYMRDLRTEKPTSPADYTIKGAIVSDNQKRGVQFSITTKENRTYNAPFISGPVEQTQDEQPQQLEFYKQAASTIVELLNNVRYADNVGIEGSLNDVTINALEQKVSELMCIDKTPCQPRAEAAIPLLTKLIEVKPDRRVKNFELLGDAHNLTEDYVHAAEEYDKAWKESDKTKPEGIALLVKAAGGWYKAENYEKAADLYEQAIKLSAELNVTISPSVHLQRAKSYQFANQSLKALQALLASVRAFPQNNAELKGELKPLIKDLKEPELAQAAALLQSNKDIPEVAEELPGFQQRLADELYVESYVSYLGKDYASMDETLRQAEALPSKALSDPVKLLVPLLRALWFRDAKANYQRAIEILEQVPGSKAEEKVIDMNLAETFFKMAERDKSPNAIYNYQKASAILTHLLRTSDQTNDFNILTDKNPLDLLMSVNRKLGKNNETKILLEEKIKAKSDDVNLLSRIRVFCTLILADAKCAEKYEKEMSKHAVQPGMSIQLRAIESVMELLKRNYVEAEKELKSQSETLDPFFIFDNLRPVLLFYRVWALLALKNEAEARAVALKWRGQMEEFRKGYSSIDWYFDSTLRALKREREIAPGKKKLLRSMIAAMEDKEKPLPAITP